MRTHPPRARAYMRVKRSPLRTLGPLCTPVCPFGSARPVRRARAATATTKRRGSLCWRRKRKREKESRERGRVLVVGVRRACIGPTAARRLTEGRSLPGDSTLVCAAYHQFPLILNRIQRTKPARPRPATPRRPPDVYIGIEAQELAVYWVSPLHASLFAGESICFPFAGETRRR